jgi:hypothetical protein
VVQIRLPPFFTQKKQITEKSSSYNFLVGGCERCAAGKNATIKLRVLKFGKDLIAASAAQS